MWLLWFSIVFLICHPERSEGFRKLPKNSKIPLLSF
jgi:hypothetical protein